MSVELHQKLSVAEAQQWLIDAHCEWMGKDTSELSEASLDALKEEIHSMRPKEFKAPRKPRATKVSSSSSDRSQEDYNEERCDARVWTGPRVGGFGAQCSCKASGEGSLCKRHTTEASKHDGMVKNGFFNLDRPTHHYGNTDDVKAFIPWHDVLDQMPAKKAKKASSGSSSAPRKCGICGEVGHNKRKCPHAEAESASMSVADLEQALAAAKAKEVADAEAKKALEEQAAQEVLEEDDHDLSAEDQAAAGTGLPKEEELPEPEPEPELEEDLDEDTEGESHDCSFEGVEYTRNSQDKVYDDDFDEAGTWDGEKIVFSKAGAKMHKMAKAAL